MDKNILLTLCDEGTMSALYKAGVINSTVFIDRDIYLWVDAQIRARGISRRKAVLEAEVFFGKSSASIWRALKRFS